MQMHVSQIGSKSSSSFVNRNLEKSDLCIFKNLNYNLLYC